MNAHPRERILDEINAERERQDAQWGGREHDDQHIEGMWTYLIGKFKKRAELLQNVRGVVPPTRRAKFRAELVKIAALAVAAIEALDRQVHP